MPLTESVRLLSHSMRYLNYVTNNHYYINEENLVNYCSQLNFVSFFSQNIQVFMNNQYI